jgi:two-component system sporulation sensor kinase B
MDGALYVIGMVSCILLVENQRDSLRIRREVERSEKLNLISELAASVAHEIRNPLTVARGFIQLAKEDLDERKRHYMETVITELDRTDFIISDFLNFSKPQLERVEVIDVENMILTVCNIMQPFAMMHDVNLVMEADSNLRIHGDDAKLKQAIMNLIKNSIEAMPDGGRITIRTEMIEGQVSIRVLDTGEGMNDEQLQRLGQPFYSTKEKGTGLGLMVTFRLVEAMHGKLIFHSVRNKGTEAILLFPKSKGI